MSSLRHDDLLGACGARAVVASVPSEPRRYDVGRTLDRSWSVRTVFGNSWPLDRQATLRMGVNCGGFGDSPGNAARLDVAIVRGEME